MDVLGDGAARTLSTGRPWLAPSPSTGEIRAVSLDRPVGAADRVTRSRPDVMGPIRVEPDGLLRVASGRASPVRGDRLAALRRRCRETAANAAQTDEKRE